MTTHKEDLDRFIKHLRANKIGGYGCDVCKAMFPMLCKRCKDLGDAYRALHPWGGLGLEDSGGLEDEYKKK